MAFIPDSNVGTFDIRIITLFLSMSAHDKPTLTVCIYITEHDGGKVDTRNQQST